MSATSDIYATVNTNELVLENATPVTKMWRIFLLPSELRAAQLISQRLSMPAETYAEAEKNLVSINEVRESGEMGIFTAIASPGYSGFLQHVKRHEALMGLSELALAATAFKASTGRFPLQVEELVPEFIDQIPPGPYDGQRLKMKLVDGGLDFYSAQADSEIESDAKESVHFYLGRKIYEENRIKLMNSEKR